MSRALLPRALAHIAQAGLTVVLAIIGMHLLLALAPGDAIDLLPNASAVREQLTAQWGLDRPWWARVADTLTGRLGMSLSIQPGRDVSDLIAGPILRSAGLWLASVAVMVVASTGLALARSRGLRVAAAAVSIVPVFLLAHLLNGGIDDTVFAAVQAGWMTSPSWFPLPLNPSWFRTVLAVTVLAVGSATLADASTEASHRVQALRRSVLALATRSRGESEWTWLGRHLAIFVTELVQSRAPVLLGGLVIAEKVFLMHGAGTLLWDAAVARDAPVALALTAVFALAVAAVRVMCSIAHDVLTRGQKAW